MTGSGSRGPRSEEDLVPDLGLSRLLLVATGSVSAADLPFWSTWLRTYYPELQVTVVLTPNARRFVTRAGLQGRVNGEVLDDVWPDDDVRARHVELSEWAQAVLVFPCTFSYCARLALGLADSPSLLAAQCTPAPVVLAPALPPGGAQSPAFRQHLAALVGRVNVTVVPPQPGYSTTTGRLDAWAPALLPHCVEEVERLRLRLAALRDGAGAEQVGSS